MTPIDLILIERTRSQLAILDEYGALADSNEMPESDLTVLLASMRPALADATYGFGELPAGAGIPPGLRPFATVAEAEALTVVAPEVELAAHGIAHQPGWARISLSVHSDLAAVGLTAAIAAALADEGISANVIAGSRHDHLFVPWERRRDAMHVLAALTAMSAAR